MHIDMVEDCSPFFAVGLIGSHERWDRGLASHGVGCRRTPCSHALAKGSELHAQACNATLAWLALAGSCTAPT